MRGAEPTDEDDEEMEEEMSAKLGMFLSLVLAFSMSAVLVPAQPAEAAGTFWVSGTFEFHNGFSKRRSIAGYDFNVATTSASGMGDFVIDPSAFSQSGDVTFGKAWAAAVCPTGSTVFCFLQQANRGFQAFPGFPVFAQVASTYVEKNAVAGNFGAASDPGNFSFCPQVGNPANGTGLLPNCPGLQNGFPAGVDGLVQYSGGAFGGTMSILRDATVVVSQRRQATPSVIFQHDVDPRTFPWMAGVPMSSTAVNSPATGQQTVNPVFGPNTSIQTAGTVLGLGTGVLPSTSTGFPWTTGMVRVAEDSCNANPTQNCNFSTTTIPTAAPNVNQWTITGADNRAANGEGTISLVAGGIFQNRDTYSTTNRANLDLTFTLPEPSTTVGFAMGALLLGRLARRRSS